MSKDSKKSKYNKDVEDILNFVRGFSGQTDEDAGEETSDVLTFSDEIENNEQETEKRNANIDSIQNVPIETDYPEKDSEHDVADTDFEYRYSKKDNYDENTYDEKADSEDVSEDYTDYGYSEDEKNDDENVSEDYADNGYSEDEKADNESVSEDYTDYGYSEDEKADNENVSEDYADYGYSEDEKVDNENVSEDYVDNGYSEDEKVDNENVSEDYVDNGYSDDKKVDNENVSEDYADYGYSEDEKVDNENVSEVNTDYGYSEDEKSDNVNVSEGNTDYGYSEDEKADGENVSEDYTDYGYSEDEKADGEDVSEDYTDYDYSEDEKADGENVSEDYTDYGYSEDEKADNENVSEDYTDYGYSEDEKADNENVSEDYTDNSYSEEEKTDIEKSIDEIFWDYDYFKEKQSEDDSENEEYTYTDTDLTADSEMSLPDNEAEQEDNEAIEGKDLDKPLIYIKEKDTDLSEIFGSELTYSREIDITSIVSRLNSLNNDDDDYSQTVAGKLSGIERDAETATAEEAAKRKAEEEKDLTVRTPVTSDGIADKESTDNSGEPIVIYTDDEEVAAEETSPTGSSAGEDSFIAGNDLSGGEHDAHDEKPDSDKTSDDKEHGESPIEEIFSQSRPEKDNSEAKATDSKKNTFDFAIPAAAVQDGEEADGSSKKSHIIIPIIVVLVLLGAAAFFYFFILDKGENQGTASSTVTSSETDMLISQLVSEVESKLSESSAISSEVSEPEEPVYTGPYSDLTGLPIAEDKLDIRPLAFMMNNIEAAQPLLGISRADIVYELVVEGGITRLLGVFGDPSSVSTIGSIRSARPDFIYLAKGLDAIFFHVGTSVQARDLLDTGIITSFDLGYYDSMCWRDTYRMNNLGYEHSLVTSGDSITKGLGYYDVRTVSDSYKGFAFSDASPVISGDKATYLTARFSTYKTTSFEYDENKKAYGVYQFGTAQYDGTYDVNNTVTNVITIFTNVYQIDDEGHMSVDVIGSGDGYYMSHGRIIPITWAKTSAAGAMILYTLSGKELELCRGRTYICVVPRGMDAVSWE